MRAYRTNVIGDAVVVPDDVYASIRGDVLREVIELFDADTVHHDLLTQEYKLRHHFRSWLRSETKRVDHVSRADRP